MYEIYRANSSESPNQHPKPIDDVPAEPVLSTKSTKNHTADRDIDDYSETMRQESPTSHWLAAYAPKPINVAFDSQSEAEKVVLLLRQHPVVLFKQFLIFLAGLVFPVVLNLTPFLNFLPDKFHSGFFLAWYVVLIGFALQTFLVWFFNVYIVTDERIIDIDFLSIVFKNVSAAKIDNIEDITVTTSGAFESLLDFGTVQIQTAAEKNEFEFEHIPHPTKVAAILNDLLLEEEREKVENRVV